jgi:hypothetical protein
MRLFALGRIPVRPGVIVLSTVLIGTVHPGSMHLSGQDVEPKKDLLAKIKQLDKVYFTRCTFEVEEKHESPDNKIWDQFLASKCVLTIDGDNARKAMVKEMIGEPVPNVDAISQLKLNRRTIGGLIEIGSARSVSIDPLGNRIVHLKTNSIARFDKEISGATQILSTFVISPTGQLTKDPAVVVINLNQAESTQLVHEQWRVLLASGRGYSKVLDEITGYKELPDGLVHVTAKCFDKANLGIWEVTFDRASSYLARRVRYFRPNDQKPSVELHTEGEMSKDDFILPMKANLDDRYFAPFSAIYTFKNGRFEFDQSIYRRAEELVRSKEPFPPGALISDARTDPETNFQAEPSGKKPAPPPTEEVGSNTAALLMAGNAVAVGLLTTVCLARKRRRKCSNTGPNACK